MNFNTQDINFLPEDGIITHEDMNNFQVGGDVQNPVVIAAVVLAVLYSPPAGSEIGQW